MNKKNINKLKFYVESGDFQMVILADNFFEAGKRAFIVGKERKYVSCLANSTVVSEKGFFSTYITDMSIPSSARRKRVNKLIDAKIIGQALVNYKRGQYLAMDTNALLERAGFIWRDISPPIEE